MRILSIFRWPDKHFWVLPKQTVTNLSTRIQFSLERKNKIQKEYQNSSREKAQHLAPSTELGGEQIYRIMGFVTLSRSLHFSASWAIWGTAQTQTALALNMDCSTPMTDTANQTASPAGVLTLPQPSGSHYPTQEREVATGWSLFV